jgi:hypothetical protein
MTEDKDIFDEEDYIDDYDESSNLEEEN